MTADAGQFAGFGPNEWLVYEMYQQYQRDPDSVDKAWWDFFSDYSPAEPNGSRQGAANGNGSGPSQPAEADAPAKAAANASPPAPVKSEAPPAGASLTDPSTPAAPTPTRPAIPSAPSTPGGRPLKGAAARTVTNMEASLAVPTATSVRAVPAKLLVDNRVVINNHLRRGRGGKVSFTHLIGYALIRALADYPAMNPSYAESDGKPTVIEPEHVNLGLAIDVTRRTTAPVRSSCRRQERRVARLLRFWAAYEDVVRKARSDKLTPTTSPGRRSASRTPAHRHGPLGAAPDAGPGRDHRRRRDGVPRASSRALAGGSRSSGSARS